MNNEPTSRWFISQRLRLHYLEWGNAQSPLLILMHGGRDHAHSWDWVARALATDWRIIAPDLRGHGDSAWSPDGDYSHSAFIYDLAELIHQLGLAPATIVAHSLGGSVSLRYAGIYPENVRKIVAIEGLGMSPKMLAERDAVPVPNRWKNWIEDRRSLAGRTPRRYSTFAQALDRMRAENSYLSDQQAHHLTHHGARQNEDGTFSWKFDNYVRLTLWVDLPREELQRLWGAIKCPTLLCSGETSWASNPEQDGRAKHFTNARTVVFPGAGHWPQHDQFDLFMTELSGFL
jgi:pimeloyl-ACP methyl ester carboxylesterase